MAFTRHDNLSPSTSSSSESSDSSSLRLGLGPSPRISLPPVARTMTPDSEFGNSGSDVVEDDDHGRLLKAVHHRSRRGKSHAAAGQPKTGGHSTLHSFIPFTPPRNSVRHENRPIFSTTENEDGLLRGWKTILLGSWLNILILFMPVTFGLTLAEGSTALICIFAILAMVPLVRLHDLSTSELAMRIGGTRTGLLNASMSNTVELVVAVIALRKCELRVVQSSLIGAILSKLLLVVGICFFAGGMRFSEQAISIDHTAIQINSTLLSVSVTTLLIPAVFHFAYKNVRQVETEKPILSNAIDDQAQAILSMSRAVSVVLFAVYIAYLVFQLYSHRHLYKETLNSPSQSLKRERRGWRMSSLDKTNEFKSSQVQSPPSSLSKPDLLMPLNSPLWERAEKGSLAVPDVHTIRSGEVSIEVSASHPTIRVVNTGDSPPPVVHRTTRVSRGGPDSPPVYARASALLNEIPDARIPQLSWFMTILLLAMVTVLVGINVEWLVSSMDSLDTVISKEWMGLILIPSVSTIAECITAINVSMHDQLALSMSVAIGSTIQTALFIIPFMVTLGWAIGKPLGLLFDPFESAVLYLSVTTMNHMLSDGKSNWLEGIILICLYVIIGVSFWFYPGSNFSSTLATCS